MAVTLRDAEALVGVPYVDGEADCMHLALRAARELFGRDVAWPMRRHPSGGQRQTALMKRHAADLARGLGEHEQPVSGDLVLWTRPHEGGSQHRRWHVGTVILGDGRRWVLHTSQAMGGSVLQPLEATAAQGLKFEGFYRWL